jgi:hypothetical protein
MAVETLETPEHTFNLLNRDQSTPLLKPDKWNADTATVVAWVDGEGLLPSVAFCIVSTAVGEATVLNLCISPDERKQHPNLITHLEAVYKPSSAHLRARHFLFFRFLNLLHPAHHFQTILRWLMEL